MAVSITGTPPHLLARFFADVHHSVLPDSCPVFQARLLHVPDWASLEEKVYFTLHRGKDKSLHGLFKSEEVDKGLHMAWDNSSYKMWDR